MVSREDWFLPAIYADGTVEHCLDQVIEQEQLRILFLKSLKSCLCSRDDYVDTITQLKSEVLSLKKTLDVRLGVLDTNRFPAWFRVSSHTEWGPFPGKVIKEPIFTNFPRDLSRKVRNEILSSWELGEETISSIENGDCLWLILLGLNSRLKKITVLEEPFQDITLFELPEGLPDDLSSPSLIGFLSNVRGAVDEIRKHLDDCFFDLFAASEKFLLSFYRKKARQRYDKDNSFRPATSSSLRTSLHFMNFDDLPDDSKLIRNRYIELARSYHPDVHGGDESLFKDLTHHYHKLLNSLPKSTL